MTCSIVGAGRQYFYKLTPEFEYDFVSDRIDTFYNNLAKNHIIEFWLEITLRWSTFLGKPFISSSKTGFGEKLFAEITDSGDGERQILRFLDLKCPVFATKDDDSIINLLGPVIVDEENNLLELYCPKWHYAQGSNLLVIFHNIVWSLGTRNW